MNDQKSCTFVFIRHGQTEWNRKKKMQGQINIPLNETGKRQAKELASKLDGYDFELCYSSPLIRSLRTAQTVIGDKKVPIIKNELLAEQSYGLCEGQWQTLVFSIPCFRLYQYQHHPQNYVPADGGESMADMIQRAGRALEQVLRPAARSHHTVLVSAHGSMICAFLNRIEKVPLERYWDNLLDNCGYAVVTYAGGAWTVQEKH